MGTAVSAAVGDGVDVAGAPSKPALDEAERLAGELEVGRPAWAGSGRPCIRLGVAVVGLEFDDVADAVQAVCVAPDGQRRGRW